MMTSVQAISHDASMTALLRIVLVGGIAGYVAWAWRAVSAGAAVLPWVVAAPFVYLAIPALTSSFWFVLAWWWRTPRPAEAQLGFGGSLRLWVGEVLAIAASIPLLAFHRSFVRDPAPAQSSEPIILVHGLVCNQGIWFSLKRFLASRGVGPAYSLSYGPPFASIEIFAAQLAAKIDAVLEETGAQQVTLVAHSMGGLVSRAYLRRYGSARVARLVTVGTPHRGSMLAWVLGGESVSQLRPQCEWLAELNLPTQPLAVPTTAIWSRHDNMVAPQVNAMLEGAENIAVVGIGHNALLYDRSVHELVLARLPQRQGSSVPVASAA